MFSNWKTMFGAQKPKANPDADVARDFGKLESEITELRAANAGLDATADKYKALYSTATGENAHLRAENAAQAREIAALRPDAERYRAQRAKAKLNLRQFRQPTMEERPY